MITYILIGVTVLVSYACFKDRTRLQAWAHHPYSEQQRSEYYRLLTSGFVHGSTGHLFVNMFVLYQFGYVAQYLFDQKYGELGGSVVFLVFYMTAIVVANLGTFIKHRTNHNFSSVGASGATSALVFIYVLFDPWQMFIFPPIPAILFAVLYLGYSTWASSNKADKIDHQAHLWGGLYGLVFMALAFPEILRIFTRRFVEDFPL